MTLSTSFRFTFVALLTLSALLGMTVPEAHADLFFPQIAAGGGFVTTVTLMHTDIQAGVGPASGTLRFYRPDGSARVVTTSEMGTNSEFTVVIPIRGTRTLTVVSTDPVVGVGAARFDITDVAVNGVATYTFGSAVVGVLAADPTILAFVPLNTRSGFLNGVAIQNPTPAPVNLRFRLFSPNGTLAATSTPPETNPLPPNGQFARYVGPEMGFNGPIAPDSTLEIEVQGLGSFVVLSLVDGNGLYSSSAVVSSDVDSPVTFAHVVDGGGYATAMRLFNPNPTTFSGSIRFFNPNGSLRSIALVGRGVPANTYSVSIPSKGTLLLETTGSASTTGVGMARVDGPLSVGGTATIFFDQTHVGVPGSSRMRLAMIPVNTTTGNNTGVVLSALEQVGLQLRLQNRDGFGPLSQPAGVNPLVPNGQFSRYVTEMGFTGASNLSESSLLIESLTGGTFSPLALLERNGVYSTTATARVTAFGPAAFGGSYRGTWNMQGPGFSDDGDLIMTIVVNPTTNAATITLDITDIFDNNPAPPLVYSGNFTDEGFTATALNGQGTLSIKPDGTFILRPNITSSDNGVTLSLVMSGEFTGSRFTGTFDVLMPGTSTSLFRGTWVITRQ